MTRSAPPRSADGRDPRRRNGLFEAAVIYGIGNVASQAVPFFLIPVLTRYMSTDGYGIVVTFQALLGVWIAFVGLNTHAAIARAYFDDHVTALPVYIGTCGRIFLASTVAVVAVSLLLWQPLAAATRVPGGWVLLLSVATAGQFAGLVALRVWQADRQAVKYAVFQVASGVMNFGISLVLVVALGLGWQGRLAAIVIAFTLSGIVAAGLLWREGWVRNKWDRRYAADALQYSVPLIPHTLSAWMMVAADRILLTSMLGPAATGVYGVGQQVGMGISLAQNSFNQAWVPWFFERMNRGTAAARREIRHASAWYILALAGGSAALALAARPIVALLAPPEYAEAAAVLPWIAVAFFFAGLYKLATNYLFYWKDTKLLAALTVTMAVIQIALTWYGIRVNGAVGAAQAAVVGWALYAGVTAIAVWRRRRPMPLEDTRAP